MLLIAGYVLLGIGFLMVVIFGLSLLIKAFKTSVGWGIASLLLPFAILVFTIKFWGDAGKPFLLYLVGAVVCGVGAGLCGSQGAGLIDLEANPNPEPAAIEAPAAP